MDNGADYRGPRLGDSASLWNFTPSPGWSKTEVAILRLCLMTHGVGRWVHIIDSGLLPGKMIQQLNGQTQRLLGQQSLAAYTGLKVDVDRIRADNEARTNVERKAGLIIWSGPNPTKEMKAHWQKEAQAMYGLREDQIQVAQLQLEEVAATLARNRQSTAEPAEVPADSLMASDVAAMSRSERRSLLHRLRSALTGLHARLLLQPTQVAEAAEPADRNAAASTPLQDVSNGKSASADRGVNGASTAAVKRSAGSKRSRGGQKKQPSSASRDQKPSARGRGSARARSGRASSREEDMHEAPLDADVAEAREAALACDVARLEAMGFDAAKARTALEETNCDVDLALEWLLTNCV